MKKEDRGGSPRFEPGPSGGSTARLSGHAGDVYLHDNLVVPSISVSHREVYGSNSGSQTDSYRKLGESKLRFYGVITY